MKKKNLVNFTLLFFLMSGICFAGEHQKSSWYIGFGVGTGQLKVEGETMDDHFDGQYGIKVNNPGAINFGVGAILTPKLHLGFDLSAIAQTAESELNSSDEFTLSIANYLAALTFYPMEEGFFLKAGLGICALHYEIDAKSFANISDDYGGVAFLLGIGYDFWIGKSFNLGLHAEYSRQSYEDDNNAPDDTEFLNFYLSFYWF
ncbi:MAG: outer membrane beta-barrel protein [Desulfobacterales bacterium]|nr:outer membrane beta-barrel protein [Desulfobacterales bacterium]